MKTIKQVSLFFKEGNSDKEYHIQLVEQNEKFIVNFQYGRVGSSLRVDTKTPIPVTIEEALKIYEKLLKEKEAKGYKISS